MSHVFASQIEEVGEVVLEVGAPNGWGPVGMDLERMEACLKRAGAVAAAHGAGISLLRPMRQAEVQTATGPGERRGRGRENEARTGQGWQLRCWLGGSCRRVRQPVCRQRQGTSGVDSSYLFCRL